MTDLLTRPAPDVLELKTRVRRGAGNVEVHGDVDAVSADRFRGFLLDTLELNALNLVIDLRGVTFMGAAGLRALMEIRTVVGHRGGTFAICHPTTQVHRLLTLVGLDDLLMDDARSPD